MEHVVQFDAERRTLPGFDMLVVARGNHARPSQEGASTGVAWLSSARVVRCRVKSLNERNPCLQLPARYGGDSEETAGVKPEEGGDDVKSSWPLCPGLHTSYNAAYKGKRTREGKQIPKSGAQFGL